MKRCPNGHEVSDDAKFCPQCGAVLVKKCPNGHEVSGDAKFCNKCGAPLDGERGTATAPKKRNSRGWGIIFAVILILLAFCGAAWFLGNNQKNNNTVEKVEEEEDKFNETYIKNRAKYIFANLPDHCEYNDFKKSDSKAFSSEFYSLIDKTFKIKEMGDEDAFFDAIDALAYWYRGNDSYRYDSNIFDEEKGDKMVVEQYDKEQARVSISYHDPIDPSNPSGDKKFTMKLIYENGEWVIDNWITIRDSESYDKKKELREVINSWEVVASSSEVVASSSEVVDSSSEVVDSSSEVVDSSSEDVVDISSELVAE